MLATIVLHGDLGALTWCVFIQNPRVRVYVEALVGGGGRGWSTSPWARVCLFLSGPVASVPLLPRGDDTRTYTAQNDGTVAQRSRT